MLRRPADSIRVFQLARVALAAFVFTTVSCADRSAPVRVLIIGDSISTSGEKGLSGEEPGLSYADRLTSHLGETFDVRIVACSGSSSVHWSLSTPDRRCPFYDLPNNRVPTGLFQDLALPELPVDIAVVMFGTNDSVGFREPGLKPVEPDAYAAAMDEIVDALLSGGAQTVILMIPPKFNTQGPTNPNFAPPNELLAQYREKIRARCAAGDGVVCGPDLYELLDVRTDFAPGNVHPNARGHDKIEAALYPFVTAVP